MNFFKNIKLLIVMASLLLGVGSNLWAADVTIIHDPGPSGTYAGETSGNGGGDGTSGGQSFTATKTGVISQISVSGWMPSGTNTTLKIFEGVGYNGTLLHTQTLAPQNTAKTLDGSRYIFMDFTINNTVNITSGNQYTIQFSPENTISIAYTAAGTIDYSGGYIIYNGSTNVYDMVFKIVQGDPANTAPTITGAVASQAVNDTATLTPFSAVTLADTESNNLSMTITLDNNAKGVLSGTGLSGTGPYTLASDTIANVQAKLRALTFNPTDNRVAPASTETTTFSLVANDGTTNSTTNSTTTVISTSVNDAPTDITLSNASVNQSVGTNATVGTLSDTDADTGDGATYTLVSGTGDTNNTSFNISGTTLRANDSGALSAGTYSVRVNVNDGDANFAKAFTLTVVDNVVPTASTLSPTLNATNVGLSNNLVLTFSENITKGTGNIYIKAYTGDATLQTIDVTSVAVVVSGTTATITHSTPFALNTQYYVTVDATAFDDTTGNSFAGISSKDTWKFTSVNNQTPTISNASAGQTVNDTATLTPFSGITLADNENDNISVTITLDDNAKGTLSATTIASTTVAAAQTALRAITFNPADNRVAVNGTETTTFTITVNDGNSNGTNNTTTVISTSVNDAPTLTGTPNTTVNQDASYSFTPSASDVDFGQTLTFSITNKPSWADFNTTTGKLSGTPTNSDVGTTSAIVIRVTDSIATTNLASFNLQVVNLNDTPTLATISNITKSEDFTTFNVTINPADIDSDNLKLTVGMNSSTIIQIPTNSTDWITSANYIGGLNLPITAIANKSGVVELNVTVEDPSGAKTSKLFTITVNPQDDAPQAFSMAATVGPNSQNTFDTFAPSYSDADGDNPIALKIHTNPTVGYFQKTTDNWATEENITAPFEVAMNNLANYRFNAGNNNGLNTNVNWSIMTSYDNSYGNGLWSNIVTGVVTIIDPSSNNAPDVNITDSNGNDINGTIVTIDEDGHTNPIYITFSDDYTPSAFLVGVIDSNNTSKVSLADGDFNITRISDNNVSVIITPKANVYGDITITLGAFDGDKNGTKSFTLHINSINDTPTALNFEKTINEDDNYSFSTLNPTTVYSDTNDSIQNSNELYPDIFQIVSLPQHGILHLGNNTPLVADTNVSLANLGNLVYTPQENNNTDVSFTWRAFDGESWTQTKTATIYINAIDDAPALGTISNVSKQEDGSDFNVTLVSSDVEGDSITYTAT
ncbi:MAG: Ig-like domain-containing protein, partial [Arcobacteraceae bacterium]|nr:Ig-like domain-containing protein [Arcobacteraceae bacterium]